VRELYPRLNPSDEVIDRYIDALDNLPPILVARDGIIVDGYHRWQAHLRSGAESIAVVDLGNLSDTEILRESYKANATHGHQLSTADKKRAADHLYRTLPGDADERVAEIAQLLGLAESSAKKYVSGARQDERKATQDRAWDLWLNCRTQQQIADELGVPQRTAADWLAKRERDSDFANPPASRQHFDVWSFATDADRDTTYFGRMPEQIAENLLWLYTKPGDIVVDPFAGSGTTIEVGKRMGRRVWASDRASHAKYPNLPIHDADATAGWPDDAPSKSALVVLDPPYWKQAAGRYSDDADDLGNQTLDDFYGNWRRVVTSARDHSQRAAFIVSPAQDGTMSDGRVVDLAFDMAQIAIDCGWSIERRIIVTYSTQQATGQQVNAARDARKLLKLYRDLVVLS
jgi:DNA modification methylase